MPFCIYGSCDALGKKPHQANNDRTKGSSMFKMKEFNTGILHTGFLTLVVICEMWTASQIKGSWSFLPTSVHVQKEND